MLGQYSMTHMIYTPSASTPSPNVPISQPSDEDGPGAHEAGRLRQLKLHRGMGRARMGGARVEVDPGSS